MSGHISLGPSDAKMDASLIRNLQRLCEARAAEIATLRAQLAEQIARTDHAWSKVAEADTAVCQTLADGVKLEAQLAERDAEIVRLRTGWAEAQAEVASLRYLLTEARKAIAEYIRYLDGGETHGSYDGKPEARGLRAALARIDADRATPPQTT